MRTKALSTLAKGFTQTCTSKSRAFTLIELLVVIAIIGLLASIILASLNTAQQKGRDARRVSDVKEIQLALELYFDANQAYPTSLAPLAPTYISALPTDPSSTATCTNGTQAGCYVYAPLEGASGSASICGSYHLGTSLEVNNSSTLLSDADANPASDGTVCTGIQNNNGNADFSGTRSTVQKCVSTDAGSYCYDVTP
jgi:prepilin-type N-terminal cleavage/methylation domain-containing protein